jgi:type I restriction enzyme S subunit
MNKWPKVKLGEVLLPVQRTGKVDVTKEYRLLGIRLEGQGPFLREKVTGAQTSATKLFRVTNGDFIYSRLFACRGAFGVITKELDGCYVSGEFPVFIPIPDKVTVEFLKYWFRLPEVIAIVEADCTGSTPLTRNRFKEKFFLALEIPLPPLSEQRRVVAQIEELSAQIQEARSLRYQAAEEAEKLWQQGGKGIIKTLRERHLCQKLSNFVNIRGGGTPSKSNPFYWQGTIPWVSPKDMKIREISDSIDHISEQAIRETTIKLIPPCAVLVVVRGMILVHTVPSAILRTPSAINQDIKALIPDMNLLPEYLCSILWIQNQEILSLVKKSTHDTRKLETQKLLDLQIPVPSLPEQRRIVAELDALQTQVDVLKRQQSETAAELDALLPAILDRAFKGEL